MKLIEIHDDVPLVIGLIHQRMDKGEIVFMMDDEYMHEPERIDSVRGTREAWNFRCHNSLVGSRTLIYGNADIERMNMVKRSANTWQVVVQNEAD